MIVNEKNCFSCTYKNILNKNKMCHKNMFELGVCFGEMFKNFKCLDYINDGLKYRYLHFMLYKKRNL